VPRCANMYITTVQISSGNITKLKPIVRYARCNHTGK
jgi:hypothetical protein